MEKQLVESYRQRLLDKQRELMDAIARIQPDGRQPDELHTQDYGDKANSFYNKESVFQQLEAERALFGLIQEALQRVEAGSFGMCVACGKPVDERRLDVVPWARHCIGCQQLQDRGLL